MMEHHGAFLKEGIILLLPQDTRVRHRLRYALRQNSLNYTIVGARREATHVRTSADLTQIEESTLPAANSFFQSKIGFFQRRS
jgi:hypothetical protein